MASPAQAQSLHSRSSGPRRVSARPGDSIIRDLGPLAWSCREQGLDGRVGVGAIPGESRALKVRAAMGACPAAPSSTNSLHVWQRPQETRPCPGPLTRPGCVGKGSLGRAGSSAQAFLCAHRCQRPQSGVPQPYTHGPRSACDGHPLQPKAPQLPPWEGPRSVPGQQGCPALQPGTPFPGPVEAPP